MTTTISGEPRTATPPTAQELKRLENYIIKNPDFAEVLMIDETATVEDLNGASYAQKFAMDMETKNITVLGEYISATDMISLKCNVCDHAWNQIAYDAKRRGCPACGRAASLIVKYHSLMTRSVAIIQDKKGKILQLPTFDRVISPAVADKLMIKCEHGHKFMASHYSLRSGDWCRQCYQELGAKSKIKSIHEYLPQKNSTEKFKHYQIIADNKGCIILDEAFLSGKRAQYMAKCKECGEVIRRTSSQITDMIYLCPNKCVRGFKVR